MTTGSDKSFESKRWESSTSSLQERNAIRRAYRLCKRLDRNCDEGFISSDPEYLSSSAHCDDRAKRSRPSTADSEPAASSYETGSTYQEATTERVSEVRLMRFTPESPAFSHILLGLTSIPSRLGEVQGPEAETVCTSRKAGKSVHEGVPLDFLAAQEVSDSNHQEKPVSDYATVPQAQSCLQCIDDSSQVSAKNTLSVEYEVPISDDRLMVRWKELQQ